MGYAKQFAHMDEQVKIFNVEAEIKKRFIQQKIVALKPQVVRRCFERKRIGHEDEWANE